MRKILLLGAFLGMCNLCAQEKEVTPQSFSLTKLEGGTFNLNDVLGKKIVVINFWASWCKTCSEEIPQLVELQKNTKPEEAVFIGINTGENDSKAAKFKKREGYPYLVLVDKEKTVAKKYNVLGLPQTIIISKDGKKVVFRGSRPPKSLSGL